MRVPEVERRLNELGMPAEPASREEFDKFIRAEIARWAQVIKDAKIPKM
jgi:tripartite-type tricarboxylate transporter receptor subunit TctC